MLPSDAVRMNYARVKLHDTFKITLIYRKRAINLYIRLNINS